MGGNKQAILQSLLHTLTYSLFLFLIIFTGENHILRVLTLYRRRLIKTECVVFVQKEEITSAAISNQIAY